MVWGICLELLGTFTPGGGSGCPVSHPEDLVFPRVSVQDIFFLPLLIFHDVMLDSLKDQQRLSQPVFSPRRGLGKAQCKVQR